MAGQNRPEIWPAKYEAVVHQSFNELRTCTLFSMAVCCNPIVSSWHCLLAKEVLKYTPEISDVSCILGSTLIFCTTMLIISMTTLIHLEYSFVLLSVYFIIYAV